MSLLADSLKPPFRDVLGHPKLASIQQHFGLGDGKRFLRWDRFLRGAGDLPDCFPVILIGAHFNYVNVISKELRKRVSVETKSHRGGTALLWAARSDSIDAVRLLLMKRANPNDQSRVKQETALAKAIFLESHLTSFPGTYPVVQVLLDGKADPTLVDRDGLTLLNTLVISSHKDGDGEVAVVRQLLQHSPDLWKVEHKNHGTILRHTILRNRPNIANALLDEVASQNPEWVTELLEHRSDYDTPLCLAIREQPSLIPILVTHGADLTAIDARRVSPLELAARYNRGDAIKLFIDHGLELDEGELNQALDVALESQSMEAVSVLIDKGANIDEVTQELLLLPRTTELDSRLEARLSESARPFSIRDIFHVAYHFREIEGLPIPVIARIFDFAELWAQSSTMRDEGDNYQPYDRDDILAHRIFLRSAPVVGRVIQRVHFTITAHDQGYCNNRADGVWTWFECWRLARGDATVSLPWPNSPAIVYNNIIWDWETYRVTWLRSDGRDGWEAIRAGDRICVLAQAAFPGWVNYVHDIRMDVYTSILRHTYKPDEARELGDDWVRYVYQNSIFQPPVLHIKRPETLTLTHRPSERSRLQILAAEYGALDVTDILRELVIDNHTLRLDRNVLTEYFTNPYPEAAGRELTFIYQFGDDDPQLLITWDALGVLLVEPGTTTSKAGWGPKHPNCQEHILAIIWGIKEFKKMNIYETFYRAIIEKKQLLINHDLFDGEDPWYNYSKTCIIYSRIDGVVLCRVAKEGSWMKFGTDSPAGEIEEGGS